MLEVHKSKHSSFRLKITVGCPRCCGVCVWCGWCVCVSFSLFFSQFSSFSFSFSQFSSSSFSFSSSFSSLFLRATKHCAKNRSTNTAANIEAFECDLAQGKCTAVGSLPHPLPSLLRSPPYSPSQKRRENFLLQEYFWRGNHFYYSFKLNQKKIAAGENYSHHGYILIRKQ